MQSASHEYRFEAHTTHTTQRTPDIRDVTTLRNAERSLSTRTASGNRHHVNMDSTRNAREPPPPTPNEPPAPQPHHTTTTPPPYHTTLPHHLTTPPPYHHATPHHQTTQSNHRHTATPKPPPPQPHPHPPCAGPRSIGTDHHRNPRNRHCSRLGVFFTQRAVAKDSRSIK